MDRSQRAALIADPDDYFRLALESILRSKLGFSAVYHVTTLDEAFDCLIKQPEISLSLFELNLPGVSGATSLTAGHPDDVGCRCSRLRAQECRPR